MLEAGDHLPKEILNGSPSNAKLWWKRVSTDEAIVQSNINWHLFTSEIVNKAYRCAKDDEKSCLEWADLAIELEGFLAKSSDKEDVINAAEMTAMALRANLICKFGHIDGHLVGSYAYLILLANSFLAILC